MAKNNGIFDTETIDLLGNLQSSKKPIKIINDANKQLIIDQYFDGKTFQGSVDSIKESVKISNLSDSIKDKVKNLNSDFWKDLNIAFERDENATSNIIINLPNNKYHIIYEIRYRPWYVSNYKSTVADDFLKNGFNPPSKRATYQFFADWIERVYNAESFLLTGKFKDYIKSQNLAYNGSIQVFDIYESDAKKGDKEIRKDFGSVFNLPNDPDPALPGPPTQAISGVTNKAPVVDNPNIKLPSQEVKSLTATSATDAIQQATPSVQVGPTITQAQGAATGALNQAQGAATGALNQAQGAATGALNQAQGAATGALNQAQGAIGNVQQSAGGILGNLSSGVTGAIGGGALGAGIGALAGGGKGALIGAGAGLVTGGLVGTAIDKLKPKADGMGKDWLPNKFSPESIAGNDKFVDPKTGLVGSTSKIAAGLKTGLAGGALGAGIGALAGGGQGALIGGLSGTALGAGVGIGGAAGAALAGGGLGAGIGGIAGGGTGAIIGGVSGTALGAGLSVGGVTGGALVGGGLGAGIGGIAGGGTGAAIGALSGGVVGAAAAKLASVQKGLPKPVVPKPPNTPRIKTVKIKAPNVNKTAEDALKSTSIQAQGQLQSISGQVSSLGNQAQGQLSSLTGQAQGQLNSLVPRG